MNNSAELFVGVKDIDREILLNVSDEQLYTICCVNKYSEDLCNEYFWHTRFVRKFGVDPGDCVKDYKQCYRELNGDKLLVIASKKGYLPLVKRLMKKEADIKYGEDLKYEAATEAISMGHLDVVKYWEEQGVDFWNLSRAAEIGNLNVVKYLVEQGEDIYGGDDMALTFAVKKGHLDVVKYLLELRDYNFSVPHFARHALQHNQLDMFKFLEQQRKRAEPFFEIYKREFEHAIVKGDLDIVKCFLELERNLMFIIIKSDSVDPKVKDYLNNFNMKK